MFTTSTQSQKFFFEFLAEKEQYLYIETQVYLNFLFSLCFFNLLLYCPTTNFWDIVEGTGSIIQCWCSFITIFTWWSKRASWWGYVLNGYSKGLQLRTFQFLDDTSNHWPILLCSPHFYEYVNKFQSTSLQILREQVTPHDLSEEQEHRGECIGEILPKV